jgi:twitching motility protein PilU
MLGTPTICEMVLRGEFESIKEIMEKSENIGMQTFDSAVFKLWQEGRITEEEALKNADSANNVRLKIKFEKEGGVIAAGDADEMGLSLESIDE